MGKKNTKSTKSNKSKNRKAAPSSSMPRPPPQQQELAPPPPQQATPSPPPPAVPRSLHNFELPSGLKWSCKSGRSRSQPSGESSSTSSQHKLLATPSPAADVDHTKINYSSERKSSIINDWLRGQLTLQESSSSASSNHQQSSPPFQFRAGEGGSSDHSPLNRPKMAAGPGSSPLRIRISRSGCTTNAAGGAISPMRSNEFMGVVPPVLPSSSHGRKNISEIESSCADVLNSGLTAADHENILENIDNNKNNEEAIDVHDKGKSVAPRFMSHKAAGKNVEEVQLGKKIDTEEVMIMGSSSLKDDHHEETDQEDINVDEEERFREEMEDEKLNRTMLEWKKMCTASRKLKSLADQQMKLIRDHDQKIMEKLEPIKEDEESEYKPTSTTVVTTSDESDHQKLAEEEDPAEVKTWNLRPRKSNQKPKTNINLNPKQKDQKQPKESNPQPKSTGKLESAAHNDKKKGKVAQKAAEKGKAASKGKGKQVEAEKKKNKEKKEDNNNTSGTGMPRFPKFSLQLTDEEIADDLYALTGVRPSRRPKMKRPKSVQQTLDLLTPGLSLETITPNTYKVNENPGKGK